MNIDIINPQGYTSLWAYFAVTLPLTLLSVYVITAYQLEIKEARQNFEDEDNDLSDNMVVKPLSFWDRVFWPVVLGSMLLDRLKSRNEMEKSVFGLSS